MSNDSPTPAVRKRSWPRLAALSLLIILVGLIVAWMVYPKGVTATALFEVRSDTPSLIGNLPGQRGNKRDFEIFKKTQLALLKSKYVLTSALVNPGIAALPVFAGTADKEAWLQDHLEVGYPQGGEILEIKLRGTKSQAGDLVKLVDAVAEAYRKEVLGTEKQRQLAQRDMLARSVENLSAEVKRKYEDYLDIAKGIGRSEGSDIQQQLDIKRLDRADEELTQLERDQLKIETGDDAKDAKFVKQRIEQLHKRQEELQKAIQARSTRSVELITRKSELDHLQGLVNDMNIRLEQLDIDLQAPPQIRQVQPAAIEPRQVAGQ